VEQEEQVVLLVLGPVLRQAPPELVLGEELQVLGPVLRQAPPELVLRQLQVPQAVKVMLQSLAPSSRKSVSGRQLSP
jgi:hypothetical protein